MPNLFPIPRTKIFITGANGWVGRNAYHVLKDQYELILIDNKVGQDTFNRFGIEEVSQTSSVIPAGSIRKCDLVTERDAFAKLIREERPAAVWHCAGILENQSVEQILKNDDINRNVLEVCAEAGVKVIALSSIMVMYGAALTHPQIQRIFRREPITLQPDELLSVETPLVNTETSIKPFNEQRWREALAYIKTKETLEAIARQSAMQNPDSSFVMVRLGWTGIKNPYELELEGNTALTEVPVYLDQADLQGFIASLTKAVLTGRVSGYNVYFCVSRHPQSWVAIDNALSDFGWQPSIEIVDKYATQSKTLTR